MRILSCLRLLTEKPTNLQNWDWVLRNKKKVLKNKKKRTRKSKRAIMMKILVGEWRKTNHHLIGRDLSHLNMMTIWILNKIRKVAYQELWGDNKSARLKTEMLESYQSRPRKAIITKRLSILAICLLVFQISLFYNKRKTTLPNQKKKIR